NPSVIAWLFALSFEWDKPGSSSRIHGLFERALANNKLQKSVLLWRCYLAYEADIVRNPSAARRVFFRAIHACPWSKRLWLDGFQKLSSILTLKELSDLQEVMRDKELNIRTDIYEILLQDETEA
ncbi:Protein NRDE, partial [Ananas comosus]